uniref:Ig-like domain-containing protein n=1 Tax=Astyanax mexicanus TaxID=7994 RepID=A0A8B9LMM0_ASTMX
MLAHNVLQHFRCFVTRLFFISGGVTSNTISPVESEKQVSAGNRVTLSCRYTGSDMWLYWYRQYPSSKLDNLLYIYTDGDMRGSPPPGFSAKVQSNIVNLEISSTAVSDSALYYCALNAL